MFDRKLAAKLLATGALLCLGGISPSLAQQPGLTADTIKIGTFGALTGPGYLYGKIAMNGIEVVFDEINAAGGINGRKLVLIREDDRCDPAAAIAATQKLIHQDQVFALIGGGCSNATLAARDNIEQAKIPFVNVASVADGVSTPTAPNIFTAALTASIESQAQLAYALEQGGKKIAVVSMRDAWGRSRYTPLMEEFKKKGITPIADEEMTPDANDATAQVLRLKAAGADTVIIVLFPKPAAIFLRDAQKLAFKPLLVGQSGIADPAAFEEQVGVQGATARFVTISMVKHVPDDVEVDRWRKLVEAKFPGDRLSVFNLFGVGSAQLLVEGIKRAGPDLTREKLLTALAGVKDFKIDVYGGPISCSETDHRCNKFPVWISKAPGGPVKVIGVTKVE